MSLSRSISHTCFNPKLVEIEMTNELPIEESWLNFNV